MTNKFRGSSPLEGSPSPRGNSPPAGLRRVTPMQESSLPQGSTPSVGLRRTQSLPEVENPLQAGPKLSFSGGLRKDLSASDMPPESPQEMLDLRWEKNGITVDWGRASLGTASFVIVGIGYLSIPDEEGESNTLVRIISDTSVGSGKDLIPERYIGGVWVPGTGNNTLNVNPIKFTSLMTQLAGDRLLFADWHVGIWEYDVAADLFSLVGSTVFPRSLASFEDRIIAGGDSVSSASALSWTADGIYDDWVGVDSGQIYLLDSSLYPVDHVTGFAVVGDNILAVIRWGSIYRAFETGNVAQAMGAVSWIEGVGSKSQFSIAQVPGGAIFLGTDFNVYYLTQAGVQPIGTPIQKQLKELIEFPEDVCAAFNESLGIYVLSCPGVGAWMVDVRDMLQGVVRWRRSTSWSAKFIISDRPGETSGEGFIYVTEFDEVLRWSPEYANGDGLSIEGEWTSLPILKEDYAFEKEIKGIALEYDAGTDWEIEIDISVHGDGVWDETVVETLPNNFNGTSPRTHNIWFDRAGPGMTFRFRIPSVGSLGAPILYRFTPLVRRGKSIFR